MKYALSLAVIICAVMLAWRFGHMGLLALVCAAVIAVYLAWRFWLSSKVDAWLDGDFEDKFDAWDGR